MPRRVAIKKEPLTVSLRPDIVDWLTHHADRQGVSRSQLVERLVREQCRRDRAAGHRDGPWPVPEREKRTSS